MKKNFVLTSLVAIAMSCPAMAVTDVTFSGMYNEGAAKIADGVADTTYDYVRSDGTTATGVAYSADPALTDFTYQDVDGSTKSLVDGTPDISVYTGTTTASGDIVSTQEVAAGKTASRDNYTYKNGAGEIVTLGESAQDMKETIALSSDYANGASVDVINGTAGEFSGGLYTVEDGGYIYHLSEDGTKLVDDRNLDVTPTAGSALETEFNNMVLAYNTDKAAIETAKTTTADNKLLEDANFAAANTVFENDSAKIAELDGYFATVGDATSKLAQAKAAQQVAADAFVENGELFQAAKDVYDAPILETITNGANDAIDSALAEGGAIRSELDQKVSIDDAEAVFAEKQQWVDNTLGIESANSDAVAEALTGEIAGNETTFSGAINVIDDAVSKNTSDIAANKTAIESEVVRATAAEAELDGKIALNTAAIEEEVANRIAGDEMTLSAAKAYADAKNTMSLKSAYDYTDKKVDALEDELSAGIASAAAMSSVAVSNVAKGEVSVGGGYGYYNSQSAVALGAAMGLTDNWSVNAAAGLSDSNVTFRAGTNYKFKLF
ncbi:MAG: YadA C-terminal domain-containing protein [Alphaproteobacteria bacterium]|nr:YadA C-terminal domain-containing protein [Alphaproteobacteria bacterium]